MATGLGGEGEILVVLLGLATMLTIVTRVQVRGYVNGSGGRGWPLWVAGNRVYDKFRRKRVATVM